jgi:IS30 family transposase
MVPRPLSPKKSVDVPFGVQNQRSKFKKHLTIGDKLKVLTELDSGKSNRSIAELFGISESQVRIIGRNRERSLSCDETFADVSDNQSSPNQRDSKRDAREQAVKQILEGIAKYISASEANDPLHQMLLELQQLLCGFEIL